MLKEVLDDQDGLASTFKKLERISSTEEEVFRRLIPKFQALRINMDEFEGVYPKEEIERDKRSIEMKKGLFDHVNSPFHQRAQILEALLAEQIELSEWLGGDAMTIVPTEYDDLYHGVDLAAEFKGTDTLRYLAMGVDVTTSKISIMNKLAIIKSHIKDGSLTEMKYFTSEGLPDFHGRMTNIPSIVLGADARTINELADLWLTVDNSKNPSSETDSIGREELRKQAREAQKKLAHHRAQILVLRQMEIQLETFGRLARKKGHTEIASRFDDLFAFIKAALSKKRISKADEQINESDDVFRAIRENLEKFF